MPGKITRCIPLLLLAVRLTAQEPDSAWKPASDPLESRMESFTEHSETEADFTEWTDELEQLERRPVNLNGNEEELRRLVLLNEQQVSNILAYTQTYGQMVSIYELPVIEGFNEEVVMQLLPYITLSPYELRKFTLKDALRNGRPELSLRYQQVPEQRDGYRQADDSIRNAEPGKYYTGEPFALYLKMTYTWDDRMRLGAVAEKDAGEMLWMRADTLPKGPDYYSYHFYLEDIGRVRHLAVGDYHLQFGQGLTLCNGFSMGKAAGGLASRKRAPEIKPHTSASEFNYFRGAASAVEFGSFTVTGFYSGMKIDANITGYDSLEQAYTISSLQESGLHRLPSEIADKDAAFQRVFGGHIGFALPRLRLGLTGFHAGLDAKEKGNDGLYLKFSDASGSNTCLGLDYGWSYKTLTMYGEFSKQLQGGAAMIHGLTLTPDPMVSFSAVYRNYAKNYANPLASAFGENSNSSNEKGLYMGILASFGRNTTLTAYADMFSFPWLKFRVDAPASGHEYALTVNRSLSRRGEMIFRLRQMKNPLNGSLPEQLTRPVESVNRTSLQVQLNWQALPWLMMRSRISAVLRKPGEEARQHGWYMGQDFAVRPDSKPFSFNFRYALFRSDSWDARIYAYENDLPGSFSIPACSGKGSRFYAMMKAEVLERLDIWLKYAATLYTDRNEISSGPDRIEGNVKSEIKVMAKYRF